MSGNNGTFLDRLLQRRTLARWNRAARLAPQLDAGELQRMRTDARLLRRDIDRVLHEADGRLAMPFEGGDGIRRPLGCDWAWRPELWSGPVSPAGFVATGTRQSLGSELTLFHDDPGAGLALRQFGDVRPDKAAPCAVALDVYDFGGTLLSLVLALPESLLDGLRRNHLIRLAMTADVERPLKVFCRLNIRHGPNTAQMIREMPLNSGASFVDFDLGSARLNEKRLESAWVDLIFENARMNRVVLRDLSLARHPRAEI